MKHIKLLFILLILTGFQSSDDWYTLTVTKGSYQVKFPSKPTPSTKKVDSDVGKLTLNLHILDLSKSNTSNNLIYMTNYSEYPSEEISSEKTELLDKFFNGATNGAVKNVKGELISTKKITYNGYPGRVIRIDFGNGLAVITMKMILVKNKTYMLQTITKTNQEPNDDLLKFMNSFKLLDSN